MSDFEAPPPPETWAPARRAARGILAPLDHYLEVEAASGVTLLVATLVALVWASSPWAPAYVALWETRVTLGVGAHVVDAPLRFFVDDGLMTIFFFSAGLEIRRELATGSLAELRQAALPIVAAAGGMLAPALIFTTLAHGTSAARGWGIPTATDIAFAVGVFALLGRRIPAPLRALLLALAIIDDLGAILVIALFYSSGIALPGLLLAALGVAGIFAFQAFGVRRPLLYVLPGAIVWLGFLVARVHPTIAGVVVGLCTPVRAWYGSEGLVHVAEATIAQIRETSRLDDLVPPLRRLRLAQREALPPVVRVQLLLHRWVAFGIMPLFALANAGIPIGGIDLGPPASSAAFGGAALGLVLGKPLGIFLAAAAGVRLGLCRLPAGLGLRHVALVGLVGGVGFTMAIFIAGLAFPDDAACLRAAKLGVLTGSAVAGLVAFGAGRRLRPADGDGDAIAVDDRAR